VVFVGIAGDEAPVRDAPTAVVTRFAVETVYKGGLAPGSEVPIIHEVRATSCGLAFKSGDRYTVFAGAFHHQLIASSCSATAPGAIGARELGFPEPGLAAVEPDRSTGAGLGLARAAAAAVWATSIALVTMLVLRSHRRRSA
jgi:hypothetical protein